MSAPEGVTPVYNNVVISVYGGGAGFGIRNASPVTGVGTVYKIGSNVYKILVGDKVGFRQTQCYFATDTATDTFTVVDESDILITYTTPTPP